MLLDYAPFELGTRCKGDVQELSIDMEQGFWFVHQDFSSLMLSSCWKAIKLLDYAPFELGTSCKRGTQ